MLEGSGGVGRGVSTALLATASTLWQEVSSLPRPPWPGLPRPLWPALSLRPAPTHAALQLVVSGCERNNRGQNYATSQDSQ